MKGEEVGVARDNQLRGAIDGQLEKLVVLRVAAGAHDMGDRDSFGNPVEQPQEFAAFFDRYVGIELRTGENFGQLHDGVVGGKRLGFGDSLANSLPRDGARDEQPADERVRINDNALLSLHRQVFRPVFPRSFRARTHARRCGHRSVETPPC